MAHNPLEQFRVYPLITWEVAGVDLSFTNASLFMAIAVLVLVAYGAMAYRAPLLIPSRLQMSADMVYSFIRSTAQSMLGQEAGRFMPLILTLFLFILCCNLVGLMPYGFTVTSHLVVTSAMAGLVFAVVLVTGIVRHGLHFFSLFLPKGTPGFLAPLIVCIELFSFLARPLTLAVRLGANMIGGHVMLKIFGGFVLALGVAWGWVPLLFIVVMTGFECFVAVLQAYIFTILTCVYIGTAVHLH